MGFHFRGDVRRWCIQCEGFGATCAEDRALFDMTYPNFADNTDEEILMLIEMCKC
jgi:hypothetical protein